MKTDSTYSVEEQLWQRARVDMERRLRSEVRRRYVVRSRALKSVAVAAVVVVAAVYAALLPARPVEQVVCNQADAEWAVVACAASVLGLQPDGGGTLLGYNIVQR